MKKILNLLICFCLILIFITGCTNNKYGHFEKTGKLNQARRYHTATLLPDGNVAIIGGVSGFNTLTSIEIYLTKQGKFVDGGNINIDRAEHTATLLQDGNILVMAGDSTREYVERAVNSKMKRVILRDAKTGEFMTVVSPEKEEKYDQNDPDRASVAQYVELYNPKTHTSKIVGKLKQTYRNPSTAVLLPNGKIFIYGCSNPYAEIYDPKTNTSKLTSQINYARSDSAITLLKDGRIFIAGGDVANTGRGRLDKTLPISPTGLLVKPTSFTEIYDFKVNKFILSQSMNEKRRCHSSILLLNGKVLIVGGENQEKPYENRMLYTAEVYNPKNNSFRLINNKLLYPTCSTSRLSLLEKGEIILTGTFEKGSMLFDTNKEIFLKTEKMNIKRDSHTSTILNDNNVLIVGGISQYTEAPKIAELFKVNK
jgi:hypothetical protein